MTLDNPFFVYGYVYNAAGTGITGATVSLVDITTNQGTQTATTGTGGRYTANIMNYASEGDTMQVTAVYGSNTASGTFTVDISAGMQLVNLTLVPTKQYIMRNVPEIALKTKTPESGIKVYS